MSSSNKDKDKGKEFARWLRRFRQDLFSTAFDPELCGYATTNDLADAAELAWDTVDNLYRGQTERPGMNTIRQLCKATGADFAIVSGDVLALEKKRTKSGEGPAQARGQKHTRALATA